MTQPAPKSDAASGLRRSRRRIELYTFSSLDILIACLVLLLLVEVWARSSAWGVDEVAATVGTLALAGVAAAAIHRPFDGRGRVVPGGRPWAGSPPRPRRS